MKTKPILTIQPIGGLKEIGSNLCVFNGGDENIIVDAGILFPYEGCFNLDYLIPDLSQIDPKITTHIIFTHGHEDHIGAVIHILEAFPHIKLWASPFTAKLIQRKLGFHKVSCPIHSFTEKSVLEFQNLTFTPVHLNHSIPETFGFTIQDKAKTWSLFFASDFKIDNDNPYEKQADIPKIKKLMSQSHHTLAMLDSTNILNQGKTLGEADLVEGIENIIQTAPSRLFITQFSSNIHRMQTVLNACHKHGKKLITLGRSMEFYMKAAEDTGLLEIPSNTLKQLEEINPLDNKNVFLVSGCQGDFFSSLKRIAFGEHREIKLRPEDTVAFSSKIIPGNEKMIYRMYNQIIEAGANLITAKTHQIHASGHPAQKDLHKLLTEVPFTNHLPIHGESVFLKKHETFINKYYPHIKTHLALNFDTLSLYEDGTIKVKQGSPLPPILIHGRGKEIERTQISQRRKIAHNGLAIINVANSQVYLNLIGLPCDCDQHIIHVENLLKSHLRKHLKNKKPEYIKQELSTKVRRFFNKELGYKPTCIINLI